MRSAFPINCSHRPLMQYFTFAEDGPFSLDQARELLRPVTIAYETYGRLSSLRDNAILLTHALTGDSHWPATVRRGPGGRLVGAVGWPGSRL